MPAPVMPSMSPDPAGAWAAVLARAPEAGFVYAVVSTGIYCRPACPARRPLRKNVEFFASAQAAERAGFRPCKRCSPDVPARLAGPASERVARMCALLEESETAPSLAELARQVGLGPHHAQRSFVKALGLSPKQYRAAIERQRFAGVLGHSTSVTQAIFRAGVGSVARFYQRVAPGLGMQPQQVRAGAAGLSINYAFGASTLGDVLVAVTAHGVCAVSLGDNRSELVGQLVQRFPRAEVKAGGHELGQRVRAVVRLVDGRAGKAAELPLDIRGTAFQERVWRALRAIPRGKTQTYSELAQAVGAPGSVRAVAHACAQNPLAVLVPCHRVVRKSGELAGYRWGLERKRALLEREGGRSAAAPRAGAQSGAKARRP